MDSTHDNPASHQSASSAPAAVATTTNSTSIPAVVVLEQDRPDARNSLAHILAGDPPIKHPQDPSTPRSQFVPASAAPPPHLTATAQQPQPLQPKILPSVATPMTGTASTPGSTAGDLPPAPSSANKPLYTANPTTTRRNANGSVSSVYSGNKIRHLKKEDGVPLWRKDIQYDFLKYVFEDEKPVFHKVSDGTYGHTFADVYLDAMAKSSKCSKILKDKLLTERPAALNMAMVCLLVNVGRMNTTLNCMSIT
jgi:Ino eighty subunit 1